MGKKRKNRESLRDMVDRILDEAKKPTLANPAMATHTVLMFALENMDQFVAWVNEGAGNEPDDPPKSREEIEGYMQMLHKIIDTAVSAAHIAIPGEPAPFLPGTRIVRLARPTDAHRDAGRDADEDDPNTGMFL